jgi:hypothetical protein
MEIAIHRSVQPEILKLRRAKGRGEEGGEYDPDGVVANESPPSAEGRFNTIAQGGGS